MAPEQVEKPQEVDHRADIYSLGVVFYEMLTGELPLGKFEPPSHRAQVDVRLDDVVLRSLEKSPARRYQHVSEVKTHVETIATSAAQIKPPAEVVAAASPLPRFQVIAFTAASVLMALLLLSVGWAANRMGMFFNALFVFILLMVPVRILLILWHTFHGTIEHRLWRTPLAPELARYRWRAVNRWIFWLLAAVVLQICVVPAQFTADQLFTIRLLTFGGVAVLMLLDLLPARRLYLATNAVYVVGAIFMAVQIARIYWPESKAHAVVLSMPVCGDWLVVNGGNSSLINVHYPYKEQRNAVDMEKLVDGHERTGDAHKLESYPSWGETVYAPADGKVVVAQSNLDDNVVGEIDRDHPVGNHICIDVGDGRYVMLAHLQKASLEVAEGDTVRMGQPLAKCGNSGNTSHPHLHIQVQDAPRIFVTGKGDATTVPILFRDATRMRAQQTVRGAPFFVRRNDLLADLETAANPAEPLEKEDLSAPKTIVLVRPENRLIDPTNDVRTVTVWTDGDSQPGETISGFVKRGDRPLEGTMTFFSINWQAPDRSGASRGFTWFFGGELGKGLGEKEAEAAFAQLSNDPKGESVRLVPGEPLQVFRVTNQIGEVTGGYLQLKRVAPEDAKPGERPHAIVHIRHFMMLGPSSPNIEYSAKVPAGYSLRATASSGSVNTFTPAGPYEYRSSWMNLPHPPFARPDKREPGQPVQLLRPPRIESLEESQARRKVLEAQLQELEDQGPISVVLGQPKPLFSITNEDGENYRGFFELVGPQKSKSARVSTNTSQSVAAVQQYRTSATGTANDTLPPATAPLTPSSFLPAPAPPPPQVIRPLRTLPLRSSPLQGLLTNSPHALTPEEQVLLIEQERLKGTQAPLPPPPLIMSPVPRDLSSNSESASQ
jgi:hypothetical protein